MQELEILAQQMDQVCEALPDIRRKALSQAGDQLLQRVRGRIGGRGKVQRWQEVFKGSGGGYSAVRALARTEDEQGYAVGYVTNALESGHRQTPGRYIPALGKRLKADRVEGKYMYRNTQSDVQRLAAQAAEQIEQAMARELEG